MDKHSPSPPLACLSSTSKSVATVGRAFLPLNVAHLVKQVWDFVSILGKSLVKYFQKAIAKAYRAEPEDTFCFSLFTGAKSSAYLQCQDGLPRSGSLESKDGIRICQGLTASLLHRPSIWLFAKTHPPASHLWCPALYVAAFLFFALMDSKRGGTHGTTSQNQSQQFPSEQLWKQYLPCC